MIKSVIKKTLNFAGFIMLTTIINFKELTLQGFHLFLGKIKAVIVDRDGTINVDKN